MKEYLKEDMITVSNEKEQFKETALYLLGKI